MSVQPYEPDVIEKDLCKLFPKEWLRNAAKDIFLEILSKDERNIYFVKEE